jgi:hypothetical protein
MDPTSYLSEDGSIQPETCWSVSKADTAVSTHVISVLYRIRSAAWCDVWVGAILSVHFMNLICVWLRPHI